MKWVWHTLWSTSLVLAVCTAAAWVCCGWWTFQLVHSPGPDRWLKSAVFVDDGYVLFCKWSSATQPSRMQVTDSPLMMPTSDGSWWRDPQLIDKPGFHFAGITMDIVSGNRSFNDLSWVYLPLAYFLGVFLILPLYQLKCSVMKFLKTRQGCCKHCGYDLRASGEHCPECGRSVPVRSVTRELAPGRAC